MGRVTTCPRARVAPAQTRRRAAALADTRGEPRWPMYTITRLYRTARAPDMIGAGGCTKHARGRCAITSLGLDSMDTLGFEPRALRIRSGCDTTTPGADPPPPFTHGAAQSAPATTVSGLKRLPRSRLGPVLSGVPAGRLRPSKARTGNSTEGGRRAATGALKRCGRNVLGKTGLPCRMAVGQRESARKHRCAQCAATHGKGGNEHSACVCV